jgi:hypothetical protein
MNFSSYISLIVTIILYVGTLIVNSVDFVLADQKFVYGVVALSVISRSLQKNFSLGQHLNLAS